MGPILVWLLLCILTHGCVCVKAEVCPPVPADGTRFAMLSAFLFYIDADRGPLLPHRAGHRAIHHSSAPVPSIPVHGAQCGEVIGVRVEGRVCPQLTGVSIC